MATNAYRAAHAQVEALAAPIPQTWEYIWAEYQDLKRDEDELDARATALEAMVEKATNERVGPRPPVGDRAARKWHRQRAAIEEELAPELDGLQRQWGKIRDLVAPLEMLLAVTPAPDTTALLFKLNLLWGPDMEGDDRSHGDSIPIEEIRATLMDARRLLSGEA
jgi:hypothetical protein